jgi:hypothetical protein
MTNEFIVRSDEISLIDEAAFLAHGGEELWFGALEGTIVCIHATGSTASITALARTIIGHQTAAR